MRDRYRYVFLRYPREQPPRVYRVARRDWLKVVTYELGTRVVIALRRENVGTQYSRQDAIRKLSAGAQHRIDVHMDMGLKLLTDIFYPLPRAGYSAPPAGPLPDSTLR